MKLGIVITTHNRWTSLDSILKQVVEQTSGCLIETLCMVVFDTNNRANVQVCLNTFPSIVPIYGNGNWWFTRSVNEGAKVAGQNKCTHLLILNDDTILDENFFYELFRTKSIYESNTILGAMSRNADHTEEVLFAGIRSINKLLFKYNYYIKPNTIIAKASTTQLLPSCVLPGRGTLLSLELFNVLNGLDERFIQYGSDYDLCFRASKLGAKICINQRMVVYEHSASTGASQAHIKKKMKELLVSFFDRYSVNYLGNIHLLILRNSPLTYPFTFIARILGILKANIITYKSVK